MLDIRRRGPASQVRVPPEVITAAVRWYLRYRLSYRDLEELTPVVLERYELIYGRAV